MRIRASRVALDAPVDRPTTVYYFDPQVGLHTAKVLPGEYVVTDRDVALVTLLGSCVAACMRDPVAGLGGMNHFMLPEGKLGVATDSARYGSYAMEMLLNDLFKHGARRDRIECKVFGGGSVLRGLTTSTVGEQNARFVHDYLASERIPVLAEDLRDVHPRKVVYFPRTGRTLVKRLPSTNFGEVGTLEELYRNRLRQAPVVPGGVELF